MATPPNDPRIPKSPDGLDRGLRGNVAGVTRIGPRAFFLISLVIVLAFVAILYGLNRRSGFQTAAMQQSTMASPVASESNAPRFGSDVPIVPTAAPATPAPPLLVPPTSVPNLDNSGGGANAAAAAAPAAPQGPTPEEAAAARARQAQDDARLAEEKRRRDLILAAQRSPILTGQGTDQAGGGVGSAGGATGFAGTSGAGGGAVQLASVPAGGTGSTTSGGGASGGSPSVGTQVGQALGGAFGRNGADTVIQQQTPAPTRAQEQGFLQGPTGQYAPQAASNLVLPNGGNPKDYLQAQRTAAYSPFELTAGTVIPAALITAINSELEGVIVAQVRENVYDTKTGRYLLIPKGSRLTGVFRNNVQYGFGRVFVAWNRLIFPDTSSIDLDEMGGADQEGSAGLGGVVDNHNGKIIGAALLTSVLAAGLQLAQPQQQSLSINPSAGQVLSQAVGNQVVQVGTQIINKNLNIPPVVYVLKGYPFIVVVDRDIVLPGPYRGF
jgi:type IV secretion system protein VirB10